MHKLKHILLLAFFGAILFVSAAQAQKVELKIRVVNKDKRTRVKRVESNLPRRVTTNDIINLNGMELRYNVQDDVYYVYKEVELAPKDQREFRIQIKDIWLIPEEEIDGLKAGTAKIVDMLKGRDTDLDIASALKVEIDSSLESIRAHQSANLIKPGSIAMNHVTAYDSNVELLKQVKKDITRIENLVLASGQDPGDLISATRDIPRIKGDVRIDTNIVYKVAIYNIEVENPSENEARTVPVRLVLPEEIGVKDILDPDGLSIGKDPKKGYCYVYKDEVEIPPDDKVVFNVKIRDKWDVNGIRIPPLKTLAALLKSKVEVKGVYKSVEAKLDGIAVELQGIEEEVKPTTLNAEYVAFFRDQGRRLDSIEARINRIKDALTPIDKTSKMGFKAKPPSMKSTWLIIYIILGFLAVVSLLFFLRWYGKTGSEVMDSAGEDGGE